MNPTLVISYLELRKAIGVLGIALPFLVSIGAYLLAHTSLECSISNYYYTKTHDVLVGTLCAVGFFLFAYKGYERQDSIAGNLACIFAVGVALFPTAQEPPSCSAHIGFSLHGTFAALLFLTLAYFSLFLFTKTDSTKTPTPQKLKRNAVYKVCGYVMLTCILLIGALNFLPQDTTAAIEMHHPVFWLEAIAIVVFGVSWLTKGEAILADR
jgi:hypothetical protein